MDAFKKKLLRKFLRMAPCTVAVYDDDDKLKAALRRLREANFEILDVLTPFPVHGVDKLLGYRHTKLGYAAFFFGLLGFITAGALQIITMWPYWPVNIGGKPLPPLPAFVPLFFELSVLFASLGMVAVYLLRSYLLPGMEPRIYHPRATDDRFVVLIREDGMFDDIQRFLKEQTDVEEIRQDVFVQPKGLFPLPINMNKITRDDL